MPVTSNAQRRLIKFESEVAAGTIPRKGKKRRSLGCRPLPPRWFTDRLHAYDPELEVWYNRIWGKWMIFRRGHVVMTVQNEDRSYRELDSRVFHALRKADAHTRGRRVIDEMLENNEAVKEADDKNYRAYVRDTAEETRKQFVKATEGDVGARNVPKEDLYVPDVDVLEERRQRRLARLKPNYRRRNLGYIERPD